MRFRTFGLTWIGILLLSFFAFGQESPDIQLFWQGRALALDSPIIEKNKTLFFPLRDFLPYLDAELKYSRREDSYLLTTKKQTHSLLIIPYSKNYLNDKVMKEFSTAPAYFDGVLYVPLEDFFSELGYIVRRKDNEVRIVIAPTKSTAQKKTTLLTLFKGELPLYIYDHWKKDGILYADLSTVFTTLGFKYSAKNQAILLQDQETTYTFSPSSPLVTTTKGGQPPQKKWLSHPVVFKEGKLYFPLEATLKHLGLGLIFTAPDQALLLGHLKRVTVIGKEGLAKILIESDLPLKESMTARTHGNTKTYTLPGIRIEKPITLDYKSGPFLSISADQISPTAARLIVILRKNVALSEIISTESGAEIRQIKELVTISEEYLPTGINVTLHSKGELNYKLSLYKNPDRLVLDLPDTLTRKPTLSTPNQIHSPYKRIRSALFQAHPPRSRVVFDMQAASPVSFNRTADGLTLFFPYTATLNRNASLAETKSSPQKKANAPPKPAPKPKKTLSLEGKLIVVDAGHGGDDPGAIVGDATYEKFYTLDIAKRLEALLTAEGAHTIMTRSEDQNPSLETRSHMANINNADIFVSVHINAFFNPFTNGSETFYYKYKDEKLAHAIHESMLSSLKLENKGLKRARLYVLRNTTMPAVLVEPLFMSNKEEFQLLDQPHFRQRIADALYKGILHYFKN